MSVILPGYLFEPCSLPLLPHSSLTPPLSYKWGYGDFKILNNGGEGAGGGGGRVEKIYMLMSGYDIMSGGSKTWVRG